MSSGHQHSQAIQPTDAGHARALWLALGLTTTFLIAEVIGGLVTGSLALISDAAHMFTDSAALAISLVAIVAAIARMHGGETSARSAHRRTEVAFSVRQAPVREPEPLQS